MTLLAQSLSERGHTVAQIVLPVADAATPPNPRLALVYLSARARNRAGRLLEVISVWRALRVADGSVVIVRTAAPVVGLAAIFCLVHRRRFVFSAANDSDFTFGDALGPRWHRRSLYRIGVRLADSIVVQSGQQAALARQTFPQLRSLIHIPSFAESEGIEHPPRSEPVAFLWLGRVVDYKQPLRYLDLARALPDARFLMVPVEDAAHEHRSLLAQVLSGAQSIPNLELLEPASHATTLERICQAVAVVSTSRLEGMPNVFLEAWSEGIPVLSLDFDPDAAIRTQGLGVAADGSWEGFVQGARKLWEARSRRDETYAHGREYVARTHSYDAVGARWSQLVTELGGGSRR
jgi:glycosyltransferase involved in cell wall biosynthesis